MVTDLGEKNLFPLFPFSVAALTSRLFAVDSPKEAVY